MRGARFELSGERRAPLYGLTGFFSSLSGPFRQVAAGRARAGVTASDNAPPSPADEGGRPRAHALPSQSTLHAPLEIAADPGLPRTAVRPAPRVRADARNRVRPAYSGPVEGDPPV
ncbi:hypothetical protein GCM10010236_30900 [Streptomyces eurythermus]|nr:hypothetical protein GCM10010236_30900 [Streptomyces eurythermus]